jgi:hypothetical protein
MKRNALILSHPALWITLVVVPLPFLLSCFYFFEKLQTLDQLKSEMQRVQAKTLLVQENERRENSLLASLKHPDPHYLDKNIETLTFLLPELKKLERIHAENGEEERSQSRLCFLKDGDNRLLFSEEQIRTQDHFREIEERQQRPVEMNEEDLKKLLCLVEGITIWPYGPKEGRPQLIITDFSLTKKETPSQEKLFTVSMQILKREYNE